MREGWKCPCCGCVFNPENPTCIFCHPFLRELYPEISNGVPRHDCTKKKAEAEYNNVTGMEN